MQFMSYGSVNKDDVSGNVLSNRDTSLESGDT